MELTYQYTKRRSRFGCQELFCEQGPQMCDSIATHVPEHKNYILRNPVHELTQHTPRFSQHDINTIRAEYATTGSNHAEGGWPNDVNIQDPEATQRYRRRIEKDDPYIHCIMSLCPGMEHYVLQNNAIDMYRAYYKEIEAVPAPERIGCRTVNVYRDPHTTTPRPISSICWQPEGGHRYAVTYLDVDFGRNPHSPFVSYIWDVENANYPEVSIDPPCPLVDLQYNARDINMIAGGLLNGQVGVWDGRKGGAPSVVCPPHVAHRDLVRNVIFVNAKSGQEFYSAASDGCCKWWDVRKMEEPIDEMIIDVVKTQFDTQSMANANGVSVAEFEPTIPTRFMVGTENGLVIGGNRKGKTPMEKLPAKYEAHVGPVFSLERNPSFLKNFLTVGDWTARVWSEDCKESAVLWSPPLRYKITAGTWSPTRLSLMVLTQWNGVLAMWDLLRRQHEPVLTMQGCLVACGSQKGNIYMAELTSSLASTEKNDKALLTGVFERESKRERILEARMREIRLKQRQAEEGSPVGSLTDVDGTAGDRDLLEATNAFTMHVKRELAAIFNLLSTFLRELRALASHVCWREEYVRTFARWERCGVVGCGGSAVHAALDPGGGTRLALLTGDDVTLTVWQYSRGEGEWVAMWRCALREWAGVGRVQWAGSRLLLAGPLALAHAWELLVIQLDEACSGRVLSRARCGAGGAGCWADAAGEVFLSLELAVFAPGVAATTVWLNSASQETQSEHAGVRAPLYRIYNEAGEHFTQALVVECPAHDPAGPSGTGLAAADPTTDLHFYLNAIRQEAPDDEDEEVKMRVLVTTSGCGRGGGGLTSAWGLTTARPPAVSAEHGGDLRERARRAAAAPPPPAPAPGPPPAEHEVRALCTPPDDTCALPAPVAGLTPHPSGRCLWVTLSSGEPWCLSLPTLRPLRHLTPSSPSPSSPLSSHYLYYIHPAVSDRFLASPLPALGAVGVWSARGGGAAPPHALPPLPAPPVQCLLLPHEDALLVLVADTIHIWRSRARNDK